MGWGVWVSDYGQLLVSRAVTSPERNRAHLRKVKWGDLNGLWPSKLISAPVTMPFRLEPYFSFLEMDCSKVHANALMSSRFVVYSIRRWRIWLFLSPLINAVLILSSPWKAAVTSVKLHCFASADSARTNWSFDSVSVWQRLERQYLAKLVFLFLQINPWESLPPQRT